MPNRWRELVLQWLKVPPEPHPPAGAPASLRVFRAGGNYLKLRLWTWGFAQAAALAGIMFWAVVLIEVERAADAQRAARAAAREASRDAAPAAEPTAPPPGKTKAKSRARPNRNLTWPIFKQSVVEIVLRLPSWAFPLIWFAKVAGIALYLVQIPFTYAVRRLDYELRWYAVTDRSLRIRAGIVAVQESTLSFANIQQVVISQGPLQRLLGLADVRVQSAGGGGDAHEGKGHGDSLHTAVFHAVDNAPEIRDLILDRLRLFRASGVGDPDEPAHAQVPPASGAALAAAAELLAEARALRRELGQG
ncbi:MAG: PH domain-containing protein [Opitutaceae bacterium]|nr:PH domain-containing protein [Opitutaceae bacterium]